MVFLSLYEQLMNFFIEVKSLRFTEITEKIKLQTVICLYKQGAKIKGVFC